MTIEVEIKSLKTRDDLIEEMQVGTDAELNGVKWQPYDREKVELSIPPGDGEKFVYARLRDKAGNLSPIEYNRIILDTSPPENCRLVINKGEAYSNDKHGRVLLNAYASGASQMMISNTPEFNQAQWETYIKSKKWVIDIYGEGEKTVYAKFRDEAGNESPAVESKILFDITPPQNGQIVINDGANYTRSNTVQLAIKSEDATKVRLVSTNQSETLDFTPGDDGWMKLNWELDTLEGYKYVRAYFMDEASNHTVQPKEANIIYKFRGPNPPVVSINNGEKFTNHPEGLVDLRIGARENPQNMRMVISNHPDFNDAKAERFRPVINNWKLEDDGDGLKKVYVKLIDEAGNSSESNSVEIFLDRSAPTINSFNINEGSKWSKDIRATLYFDVQDASYVQIHNNSSMVRTARWEPYRPVRAEWQLLPGEGEKTVYARFKDMAENVTEIVSASVFLDTKPPGGSVHISNNLHFTNDPDGRIQLAIEPEADAFAMQISNVPDFTDVKLRPIESNAIDWQVEGDDGPKTVFIRFQDKAGNMSQVYTANILLDREPPVNCSLVINNNEEWLRNPNKKVALSMRAEGATYMMISNQSDFKDATWVPFRTVIGWTLDGPEGLHYVHARFKDEAGNVSEAITSTIMSDFTPPKVNKFSIDDGTGFCVNPQKNVTISMDVEDAQSMVISNLPLRDTASFRNLWEPYKNTREWTLDGEDGLKIIFAVFRDLAGNITPEYSKKIVLDRAPPSELSLVINKGAKWLVDPDGKCEIEAHANGAYEMMISNDPSFTDAAWEPYYAEPKSWTVQANSSTATVYVQFRDRAGNISETTSANIEVDIDPPKNPSVTIDNGAKYVENKDGKITLQLSVEDGQYMAISRYQHFRDSKWEPYTEQKEIILSEIDGEKTFYVQFRDEAGNPSQVVSASIILDTTPPDVLSFKIDNGAEWTNDPEKKVTISLDATKASEMLISDKATFEGADWEPFRNTIENYELPGEDGEKNVYLKLRDECGNESRIAHTKINLKRSF